MKLLLIRHGQSNGNTRKIIQGWGDAELTEEGLRQAECVAERLATRRGISALYSSPLKRAQQTAQAIGRRLSLQPILRSDLREIHFGDVDGLTVDEFKDRYPHLYSEWEERKNSDFRWPGGESREEFWSRVVGAMEKIVTAHASEDIVVVAHSGAIGCYLSHALTGHPRRWVDYQMDNCALTELEINHRAIQLVVHNDREHLRQIPSF